MKSMTPIKIASIAALVALAAGPARAEEFARTKAHASQSLAAGTGSARLPVFRRVAGSADAAASALVAGLCKADCAAVTRRDLGDKTRIRGTGWRLDVYGDGTMAEFTDEVASAKAQALAVAPERVMPLARLETIGRAYIADHLSSVIQLAPGESLVARTASFRTEGGVDRNGLRAPDRVTAQRIVFTREINGLPVTGPGSKVTITFLADASVESLRYDWSTYAPSGATQSMLGAKEILARVQRIAAHRVGGALPSAAPIVGTGRDVGRVDLGGDIQLERLECGYYDPGMATRGSSALLQPGCYYHALHHTGGSQPMTAGYAGAVPAAAQPARDDAWTEEVVLRAAAAHDVAAPTDASRTR